MSQSATQTHTPATILPSNGNNHAQWVKFNIHNLVKFRVDASAPTAPLFQDMFAPFLTEESFESYDLTIRGELEELAGGAFGEAHGESEFHYNAEGIHLHSVDVQIFRNEDGFRLNGSSELLVMALPLIDHLMVARDTAMVHALTVAYRGHGICIPAWGGSGKTTTMAKLVKIDGFAFMGDDWAFLTRAGEMLAYAKPMFIKPYHRSIYPHLFKKAHKPLVPTKLSKTIHSVTTRVHPYITRYPQLASLSRRWSPEHMMVTPRQAFPQASFTNSAPVAAALFIERFNSASPEPVFEKKDETWMVSRLAGNFHSELTRQSRLVMTTLGASGIAPIEQFFTRKAAVLKSALQNKPCYLLRVPDHLNPDQASDIIVEHIKQITRLAGIE